MVNKIIMMQRGYICIQCTGMATFFADTTSRMYVVKIKTVQEGQNATFGDLIHFVSAITR